MLTHIRVSGSERVKTFLTLGTKFPKLLILESEVAKLPARGSLSQVHLSKLEFNKDHWKNTTVFKNANSWVPGSRGGPLGHGPPLWQKKFFVDILKNWKTWFGPPLCVSTRALVASENLAPPFEILNTPLPGSYLSIEVEHSPERKPEKLTKNTNKERNCSRLNDGTQYKISNYKPHRTL